MARWWIGSYDAGLGGDGRGIYAAETGADGAFGPPALVAELPSPSYLVADDGLVHAALEGVGRVVSLRDGVVERVVDSGGTQPCHLAVIPGGVIAANYGSGTVAVLGAERPLQVLDGEGSGPRPQQDAPHAHASLFLDPATVLTTDLGADRVHVHELRGTRLRRTGSLALPPGTGPRDLVLHPSGAVLALGELDGTMHALRWGGGGLELGSSIGLPGWVEGDHAAAIAWSGAHVFTGLRGSDRIAVLRLGGGALDPLGHVPCGGSQPRHLAVDGELLHIANQLSGGVATFRIGADGIPEQVAEATAVPTPVVLLRVA